MKLFLILLFSTASCFGSTLYFTNGKSLNATILEANETHVLIAREKDLQRFRLPIKHLTIDTRKQVELYHSKGRYSTIPSVKVPIDDRTLKNYVSYIDELIDQNLRSKRLQKTKPLDDYTYVRRTYLTLTGRIPTQQELNTFLDDRDSNKKSHRRCSKKIRRRI